MNVINMYIFQNVLQVRKHVHLIFDKYLQFPVIQINLFCEKYVKMTNLKCILKDLKKRSEYEAIIENITKI